MQKKAYPQRVFSLQQKKKKDKDAEEEKMEKKKEGEGKEKKTKVKKKKKEIEIRYGVCVKVGGAMGSCEIIKKCEKKQVFCKNEDVKQKKSDFFAKYTKIIHLLMQMLLGNPCLQTRYRHSENVSNLVVVSSFARHISNDL